MQPRQPPLRQAVAFVPLAFAISWLCWLPVAFSEHGFGFVSASASPLLVILGTFGPFLSAVAIVARNGGTGGLRDFLGQALRWRAGIQWYAAALIAPFVIRIVVIGLHLLKGGAYPSIFSLGTWVNVPFTFLTVLIIGGPSE